MLVNEDSTMIQEIETFFQKDAQMMLNSFQNKSLLSDKNID